MQFNFQKINSRNDHSPNISTKAPEFSCLDGDSLLTTDEVAAWLGVKPNTLAKARSIGLGNFPDYKKIGRCVRYRVEDVRRWLSGCHRSHGGVI